MTKSTILVAFLDKIIIIRIKGDDCVDQTLTNLYRKVGIIYRLTQNYLNEQLMSENLSFNEYITLMNIQPNGTSQEEIIKVIVADKARIARLLKSLEDKSYITRQQDDHDKRAKRIFLTDIGQQKLDICLKILSDWHHHISSQFDEHILEVANYVIDGLYNNTIDYYNIQKGVGQK